MNFVVTTRLEFEDRFEGQVLAAGEKAAMEHLAGNIHALCHSGKERVLSSALMLLPQDIFDYPVGHCWRVSKNSLTADAEKRDAGQRNQV